MTLEEYNKRLEHTSKAIQNSLGNTMVSIGTYALTLIKQRVIETGKDAKGQNFTPYSTKPMLVGCKSMNASVCKSFFGKEKNKTHEWVTLQRTNNAGKKIRLAVLETGYKGFRELHGRQTNHVDFSFYNNLWNSMRIISTRSEHNSGMVTVGPSTDEELKILEGNVKKRGQILDLSDSELAELSNTFKQSTLRILRDNGL